MKEASKQGVIELNGPKEESDEDGETDSIMDSETSIQQHSIKNEVSVRVDEGIDLSEKLLKQHQGAATIKKHSQIGLPVDYTKMG